MAPSTDRTNIASRRRASLQVVSVVLCGLLAPGLCTSASAQNDGRDEEAHAHFQLGRAAYDRGEFVKAAGEFEEAYRISQRATLLYNLYLAYRDANDQAKAADALRRYLAEERNVENRAQLESRLAALERTMTQAEAPAAPQPQTTPAPAPAPAPAVEQVVPVAAPLPPTAAESPAPQPHPSNLLPFILMGGGGALVVGSVVTGLMALSAQSDLEHGCPTKTACDPQLEGTKSRGKALALVTDVLMVTGVAAAATGATLFFLWRGESKSETPRASLVCVPGACAGNLRVAF